MLEGLFVTVTGFKNNQDDAFAIGGRLLCVKEPTNRYDDDAIKVLSPDGQRVGYLANNANTKANGTLSSSRIYDRVGRMFVVEVCFTTRTKIICRVIEPDRPGPETLSGETTEE